MITMHSIDVIVNNYFFLIRTSLMTDFMSFVSNLFEVSLHFILIIFFVALLIYLLKGQHYTILFLLSLSVCTVIVYFSKFFFDVPRPVYGLILESTQSFPSFHAAISTVFFIMLMYIFDGHFKNQWRVIFNILCITSIFLVALSRLYLGVHWFSDVLGGIIIGALISYLFILIFRRSNMIE